MKIVLFLISVFSLCSCAKPIEFHIDDKVESANWNIVKYELESEGEVVRSSVFSSDEEAAYLIFTDSDGTTINYHSGAYWLCPDAYLYVLHTFKKDNDDEEMKLKIDYLISSTRNVSYKTLIIEPHRELLVELFEKLNYYDEMTLYLDDVCDGETERTFNIKGKTHIIERKITEPQADISDDP